MRRKKHFAAAKIYDVSKTSFQIELIIKTQTIERLIIIAVKLKMNLKYFIEIENYVRLTSH